MHGLNSGLSILFYSSKCLHLYQYRIILMIKILQCILRSESVIHPALFFLKFALVLQGLPWSQTNFSYFFLPNLNAFEILIGIALNLHIILDKMDILTIVTVPIHEYSLYFHLLVSSSIYFSSGTSGKEPTCQCKRHERCRFNPWVRKIPVEGHDNPL